MLYYRQEMKHGSVRELALSYTCAGELGTYTTGFPAPQRYYTLFAIFLQEGKCIFARFPRLSYYDLHRVELSALHGVLFSLYQN